MDVMLSGFNLFGSTAGLFTGNVTGYLGPQPFTPSSAGTASSRNQPRLGPRIYSRNYIGISGHFSTAYTQGCFFFFWNCDVCFSISPLFTLRVTYSTSLCKDIRGIAIAFNPLEPTLHLFICLRLPD